jgi:hypothetical protein
MASVTTRYVNMVVTDIEQFGRRIDVIQRAMRKQLHERMTACLQLALSEPGQLLGLIDRGDSFAALIDPAVSKDRLMSVFLPALGTELRRLAIQSSPEATIRLRLSFHAGEVSKDDTGFSGEALNQACRIVDAQPLRDLLNLVPDADLVVALSDEWHRSVIGQGWLDGSAYRAVAVNVKEMSTVIHIGVPGRSANHIPDPAPREPVSTDLADGMSDVLAPASGPSGTTTIAASTVRRMAVGGSINVGRDFIDGDQHTTHWHGRGA